MNLVKTIGYVDYKIANSLYCSAFLAAYGSIGLNNCLPTGTRYKIEIKDRPFSELRIDFIPESELGELNNYLLPIILPMLVDNDINKYCDGLNLPQLKWVEHDINLEYINRRMALDKFINNWIKGNLACIDVEDKK